MLTIEQYIAQMKKKDKLDEFDFRNHVENMSAIMKYVMEYFNKYLNPEEYDYETVKLEQTTAKIEREIADTFPKSKAFIIEYYKKHKLRIDKIFSSWFEDLDYRGLFYCHEDYKHVVDEFCSSKKVQGTEVEKHTAELVVLAQEIKDRETGKPSRTGYKYLDEVLVSWIKATYAEYKVNLFQFASEISYSYYERYVESVYDRSSETFYHINRYNHRYNSSPFGIEEIYKENSHRPFIQGRKSELEMLIMYNWLFDEVKDPEYWPEYVNLCVATGRVSIVRNVNILLPVTNKGIAYPIDITSKLTLVETTTGTLKAAPGAPYILKLTYDKDNDIVWKDDVQLNNMISNLQETFSKYGVPYALELLSPLRSASYNEKEFFARYSLLEKKMKKYPNMALAIINGPQRHKARPSYLMQTTEDVIKINTLAREMKFKLKLSVDISKLISNKKYHGEFEKDFNKLAEIRHSIVGLHLSNSFPSGRLSEVIYKDDKAYVNQFDYPKLSDYLGSISALFSDNLCRYFVPEDANSPEELEELTDNLLRGGFSFLEQRSE